VREIHRKGKSAQENGAEENGKAIIVMDYKTFTVEGAQKREDSEDAEAQTKAIVMRRQGAGMLVGHRRAKGRQGPMGSARTGGLLG